MKYPATMSHASQLTMGLLLGLRSVGALAQDTADTGEPSALPVEEVVVTGIRQTLQDSLNVKRESRHVVETLDLGDIDSIPDITIADALTRLPGVNGARDRGNQSQAAIRGLGPRMVLGTVNNREVASSEPGRSIRFEQYPSELISQVQVYKTQSADLTSGGIAATVNLDTVSPLSHRGKTLSLRAGVVEYEGGEDIPDYDTLGNRFSGSIIQSVNDKFGFALGFASQQQKNAYPSLQGWGFNTGGDQPNMPAGGGDLTGSGDFGYVPWGAQAEVKQLDTQRDGVMGVLEFHPSEGFALKYDAMYSAFDMSEKQNQTWYQDIGNWDNGQSGGYANVTLVGDYAVAASVNQGTGNVRHVLADYDQKNSVTSQGFNVEISAIENWLIDIDLSHSNAERENYWHALYLDSWGNPFAYDLREEPSVSVPAGSPSATPETASLGIDDFNEGSTLNDTLTAAEINVNYAFSGGSHLESIDFGVRHADREKEVIWSNYNISSNTGDQYQIADFEPGFLSSYTVSALDTSPFLDAPSYAEAANMLFGSVDFDHLATVDAASYWKVDETNQAAYAKLNFMGTLFNLGYNANIGVRVVDVETKSFSLDGEYIANSYTETLPSTTLNLFLNEEMTLRFGLSKAISRPPLDELRAGQYIDLTETTAGGFQGNAGNPLLNPFTATNIDIAYEWYFADESLFALALYHKDLDGYIGYDTFEIETSGQPASIWAPTNAEGGTIKGAEITFQTPLVAGFGLYSNYAYVDTDIEELAPAGHPYPMAGVAEHTATVDVWYSNYGFDARLGWQYHSGFTTGFEWAGSELRGLSDQTSVNLSVSYAINDHFSVRLQGNNLNNEPLVLTQNNNELDLRRYDVYGRSYMLDFTFKY